MSGGRVTHKPDMKQISNYHKSTYFFPVFFLCFLLFAFDLNVFCGVLIVLWLRPTRRNAIRVQIFHVFNLVAHIVRQIRARSFLYLFCCWCCCSGHWPHDSRNHHHRSHHDCCMHRVDWSPRAYITTGLLSWPHASAAHTVLFVHATSCAFRGARNEPRAKPLSARTCSRI